jgi:inorganic triphosphatase YgiF
MEIEMKLAAPPEIVRRAAQGQLLKGEAPPVVRKLYSIYFDTPERDLWRRGIALRVRRERVSARRGSPTAPAAPRWVQTVKAGGTARGGLAQREEYESEVAGPVPEIDCIPTGGLAAVLASPEVAPRLEPVFATEMIRSSRIVTPAPGVMVEICVDRGTIRAGQRQVPISEIELELKSGTAADVVEFARKLVASVPFTLENRSKGERGYALAAGEADAPAGARAPALDPDTSAIAAFKAILSATLVHLQANEHGTLTGRDPEFLHQMRVALRRMRSVLRVFAPMLPAAVFTPIIADLRWLAGALGPARDWDVFVSETLAPVQRELAGHPGFGELERRCSRARGAALQRARRAIRSRRYRELLLDLTGVLVADTWLAQMNDKQRGVSAAPASRFAADVLAQRYLRVRRRGRKLESLSAAQLHRLRIAVKKLRYAADAFAGLFASGAARKLVKRLGRVQDILGRINDAATADRLLEACGGAPRTRALLEALGIVRGWGYAQAQVQKARLASEWKSFRAVEQFW